MNNQERNRDALIDHIAEQDSIIRRRNEQIAQQAENSREAQNAIEDIEAELERYRAMHSKQVKTITRLLKNPRPLTADDITDEMERRLIRKGVEFGWFSVDDINNRDTRDKTRSLLTAALTEPTRPEWADLADVLGDFAVADEHTGDRDDMVLARRLHERGVRVTGGN